MDQKRFTLAIRREQLSADAFARNADDLASSVSEAYRLITDGTGPLLDAHDYASEMLESPNLGKNEVDLKECIKAIERVLGEIGDIENNLGKAVRAANKIA